MEDRVAVAGPAKDYAMTVVAAAVGGGPCRRLHACRLRFA